MRELDGLSQTDLARKIGKKPHYINQVEKEVFKPSLKTLEDIAVALGTRPCILLDETVPPIFAKPIEPQFESYVDKLLTILKGRDEKYKILVKTLLDSLTSQKK